MPSYCHGLPLPCGKDQVGWIETQSDANSKLKSSESSEEKPKGISSPVENKLTNQRKDNHRRHLQIAAVSGLKNVHPNPKDRCINPNHVYEMMVCGNFISLCVYCFY